MNIIYMLLFCFLGTILATFIGAILSIWSLKLNKNITIFLQNFAVGAIIGLALLELFKEAVENFIKVANNEFLGALYSILIILGSGLLFYLLHELLHHLSHHHDDDHDDDTPCCDHGHTIEIFKENDKSTLIAAFIFLGAITIHNIPEGLGLGVMFTSSNKEVFPLDGVILASALFIHNFLVGFSMASSFKKADKSNIFSILMTTLSALPAFVFAIIGFFININDNVLLNGIIFSISTGSLLYVLFIELLPQIYYEYKHKLSFIYILFGLLISALLLYLG